MKIVLCLLYIYLQFSKKTAARISKLAQNWHRFVWLTTLENVTLLNPWNNSLFYKHLLKNYWLDFNSEKTFKLPIALSTFDLNLVFRPNFINLVWLSKVDVYFCIFSWIILLPKNIFAIWPLNMLYILGIFMNYCLK